MSQLPAPYKVEMTIKKQVTITAGATTTTSLAIPKHIDAGLKGYGYTYYASNTYALVADQIQFPTRTDQEGSASIPRIFEQSIPIKGGASVSLTITNGDSADHTYDIVFYLYLSQMLPNDPAYQSTGGELIINTASGAASGNNVTIYNASLTTAANVTALGLDVNSKSPTTLLQGSLTTTGATAVALAASTACKKVTLRANSANTEKAYIGNATSQTFELFAGESVDIEISNLSLIYVKRSASTNVTIDYLGA